MANASAFQPKLIYLARRHPALSREAFVRRWRAHGALGMSLPRWKNVARYVHCDVRQDVPATGPLSRDHDAVGIVWHRSPAHRAAHLADTSSRLEMERDEQATFATPIVEVCTLTREFVHVAPGAPEEGRVKLIRFVGDDRPRPARVSGARPVDAPRAAESDAPAVGDTPPPQRALSALVRAGFAPIGCVTSVPLPPEREVGWGLAVARVEEWWFADAPVAIAAAVRIATLDAPAARVVAVLCDEVELFRRPEDLHAAG